MQIDQFLYFANCISDPLLLVGDDGLLLSYNDAARQDFGLITDQTGKSLSSLFQASPQSLKDFIHSCLESSEPTLSALSFQSQQNRFYSLEGRNIQDSRATVIRCFQGQPHINPLTTKLADEVKRREAVERQLKSSQAHARAILETAVDAIISLDDDGMILSFNPSAERIFGYKADEIIGHNVSELMPPQDQDDPTVSSYFQRFKDNHPGRVHSTRWETMSLRKNGEEFHVDIGVSELPADKGRAFTWIVRDIHRRTLAEQQVKAQEEEQQLQRDRLVHVSRLSTLGELAAGIAHEVNQPLTAITNYAKVTERMLQKNWLGEQHSPEVAIQESPLNIDHLRIIAESNHKISEQARRAGAVIQRLRDLIKREASDTELIDINALTRETLVLAETDTRVNNYQLEFYSYPEPLLVSADSIQLQQVLLNFVRNGIDAMNEMRRRNGVIILRTNMVDDKWVQVSVADEGTGLTETQASQLFDPFFTTKSDGLGLGLSISQKIIQTYGGSLGYFNNNERAQYDPLPNGAQWPMVGATLYFNLPKANKQKKEGYI